MQIPKSVNVDVVTALGAEAIRQTAIIQSLWGGYGELFRATLQGGAWPSVIVKHIRLPQPESHPRGWNTPVSHQRKLDSYQAEVNWYRHYASQCSPESPVPQCLYVSQQGDEILLVLEDLHTLGYSRVLKQADRPAIFACLRWLAEFHARFMGQEPAGLWQTGTYWHLSTRPDEWEALDDPMLKAAAECIDRALADCPYQTLVHGDAKLANFCFTPDHSKVAAVDFQYVGKGCGMKDVCLFLSSVLTFEENDIQIAEYLEHYFSCLKAAVERHQPALDSEAIEAAWRPLYSVAWADFQRFVKGWSPGHWKINPYTENLTRLGLEQVGVKESLNARSERRS